MSQIKHPLQKLISCIENPSMASWFAGLRRHWVCLFVFLLATALVLRLLAMAAVPLIPEEAYYWMYAQHPELSYFDHPPMIAWVIRLGIEVFGHTEFGVRIVGNLFMIGASLLMYLFGRAWFSRGAGLVAALLLQILPVFFGVGFIATMDSALVFFWMLGLVGLTAALRDDRPWGWYLAGFALGSAILSKYTGVFFAVGMGLAVAAHRPWQRHLRTLHPYLSILLALAMFSPVILWNAQHDWASFHFQLLDRFVVQPLSIGTILSFIGFQLLIATPILILAYGKLTVQMLHKPFRAPPPQAILMYAFSLPLFSIMAYKSLRYAVNINWTIPAFLSIFPALSQWLIDHGQNAMQRRVWIRGFAGTILLCLLFNIGAAVYLLILQPRLGWISAFGPWKPLAGIVEQYEEQLESETGKEPLIVAAGAYRLASVLAFYRMPLEHPVNPAFFTTSQWVFGGKGLGYPYWGDMNRWRGMNVLFITDKNDENVLARTRDRFDDVRLVRDARLHEVGRDQYQISLCRNLR